MCLEGGPFESGAVDHATDFPKHLSLKKSILRDQPEVQSWRKWLEVHSCHVKCREKAERVMASSCQKGYPPFSHPSEGKEETQLGEDLEGLT